MNNSTLMLVVSGKIPVCPVASPQSPVVGIVDVWEPNFRTELKRLSELIVDYPIVSFDTEFPGVISDEGEIGASSSFFSYSLVKRSVERTGLIQVGITLSDSKGNMPDMNTWQFHLQYNLKKERFSESSIELLREAGIDFEKHRACGIPPQLFAEYLTTSGLVLTEEVQWVCFHGIFDLAYLLKLLSGSSALPDDEYQFQQELRVYFPQFVDLKVLAQPFSNLQGSLVRLAQELSVKRIGTTHQAGSDSYVTARCYYKLLQGYYGSSVQTEFQNVLFGVSTIGWTYPEDYMMNYGISGEYDYYPTSEKFASQFPGYSELQWIAAAAN